jgi:hypothetical protein
MLDCARTVPMTAGAAASASDAFSILRRPGFLLTVVMVMRPPPLNA